MSGAPISVAEICRMLEGRALDLCYELFGNNGHASSARFTVGSLGGEPGASLSVRLMPNMRGKIGTWCDFATGQRGDLLDLIAHADASQCGGDKGKAVAFARKFLRLEREDLDRAALKRQHDAARRKAEAKAKADATRNKEFAFRLWGIEAVKDWRGTPVESYLRDNRAIAIDKCGSLGALRYHPDCLVSETGELLPAMVAAVAGPDGKFAACHRTYLEEYTEAGLAQLARLPAPNGDGTTVGVQPAGHPLYRKASIESPKRSLGNVMGGHISLHKGASGVPLTRAPAGDVCIIAEGIENGLTISPSVPEYRCIAAVSLANMAQVVIPETVTTRILIRDAALMKPEAEAGFAAAVQFHASQCPVVRVVDFGDDDANAFAQQLKQKGAAA